MNNLGIVFPGQGSQSVGMLADVATRFAADVKQTFDEASDALGYDVWKLTQDGPATELDKTVHTQPALLTASYAVWRILQKEYDLKPAMLAGHSLGEYTALVAANALTFQDAVKLVAARGEFMQAAVASGVGAMGAIIGLENDAVEKICQQIATAPDDVLDPANFNSIGQVVIAGHRALVERALVEAKAQGAKLTTLIPVSVPSHCRLMQPAAEKLAVLLATIDVKKPTLPIVNNAVVSIYREPADIRFGLVRQLYMPVQWVETIQRFTKEGVTQIIECGPGKVLTGLNKRIDKQLQLMTTTDLASIEALSTVS